MRLYVSFVLAGLLLIVPLPLEASGWSGSEGPSPGLRRSFNHSFQFLRDVAGHCPLAVE